MFNFRKRMPAIHQHQPDERPLLERQADDMAATTLADATEHQHTEKASVLAQQQTDAEA
ncbi:hypothetical protein [Chromobacterium violaceum]|uniref:hypothetical protein n=1 Tax=Chromobacterium violaceum TaxID=536 RepID=UPI003DA9DA5A